jgi:hypothetical protein
MNPTIAKYQPYHVVLNLSAPRNFAPSAEPPHGPTHEQIARCAYDIYIEHGRANGRSEMDWRQAKEELAHSATTAAHKAALNRRP